MKSHVWLGLGGVPAHDNPTAFKVEGWLHWPMIVIALLTIPAFYLELVAHDGILLSIGQLLTTLIFIAFTAELLAMVILSRRPWKYLIQNWLSVVIVVSSGMALLDAASEWVSVLRLLRLAFIGILLLNVIRSMRKAMTPDAIPNLLFFGVISFGLAGAVFYWLEPTMHSYAEGLWLAFVTGATVGYGDVVPTTSASKIFAVFMVLLGYAMLSLVTASIAALFVGEDERKMRRLLQQDVKMLQDELRLMRSEIAEYHKAVSERQKSD